MPVIELELQDLVRDIADVLKEFDRESPVHKDFQPGIGPFGEPQLVKEIANRLNLKRGYQTVTRRTPDLDVNGFWAVEFKIVRPFGDNGTPAENWSVNMLHPYSGNTSLIGDAIKLEAMNGFYRRCVFMIGYEHEPPKISLDPLVKSFELISRETIGIHLGNRVEEIRDHLVHPVHQKVRCIGWEILRSKTP